MYSYYWAFAIEKKLYLMN